MYNTPVAPMVSSSVPLAPSQSQARLRRFIALPDPTLLLLGARRIPPVHCPRTNSTEALSILTSVGFRQLEVRNYVAAAKSLRPDIVLGLADYVTHQKSGRLRIEKMGDRTLKWLKMLADGLSGTLNEDLKAVGKPKGLRDGPTGPGSLESQAAKSASSCSAEQKEPHGGARSAIFAPILPIAFEEQAWYMDDLQDEPLLCKISGLVVHDTSMVADLPPRLQHLPRLSVGEPISVYDVSSTTPISTTTPQDILRDVSLGVDLFATSLLTSAAEGGIAFDFTFPAPKHSTSAAPTDDGVSSLRNTILSSTANPSTATMPEPPGSTPTAANHGSVVAHLDEGSFAAENLSLGLNLHLPQHATSMRPISEHCKCYTCQRHHRAYIHHLLVTEEMLAWVLLQIHNHYVFDLFFGGVRKCIETRGPQEFEEERERFERVYERRFPERTAKGPRYIMLSQDILFLASLFCRGPTTISPAVIFCVYTPLHQTLAMLTVPTSLFLFRPQNSWLPIRNSGTRPATEERASLPALDRGRRQAAAKRYPCKRLPREWSGNPRQCRDRRRRLQLGL